MRSLREILKEDTIIPPSSSSLLFSSLASPQASAAGGGGGQRLDQSLVKQMMAALTCEELIHLVEWEQVVKQGPAIHTWLYPGLTTLVAIGHLVTGFTARQPAYVKIALSILKQQPASGARGGGKEEVGQGLVAASMCQLLLGQVAPAVALIKEAQAVK